MYGIMRLMWARAGGLGAVLAGVGLWGWNNCTDRIKSMGCSPFVSNLATAGIYMAVGAGVFIAGGVLYFPAIGLPLAVGALMQLAGSSIVVGAGLQGIKGMWDSAPTLASPIVLDLNGDGIQTVNKDNGVFFDLNALRWCR